MKNLVIATTSVFALSASLTFCLGADSTWISTSDNKWATGVNWSPATAPGANGIGAIFTDSASIQHSIDIQAAVTSVGIQFSAVTGGNGFTIFSSGTPTFSLRAGGTFSGIVNNDENLQTFHTPMSMFSLTGSSGNNASQTWRAASGPLVFSGIYSGTASTVHNNGGRLTVDGAFNTTIGSAGGRGDIVDGGGLTKSGTGTLTLGGTVANTYSGSTIVNQGSIIAAKASAFGTSALTLNGGTLNTGGFNQTFGTLTLSAESTLDLGSGSSNPTFANSSAIPWGSGTLHILGLTQGSDSVRVGTGPGSLTFTQLSEIQWDDLPGISQTTIDPNGFLVPIPEPSIVALSLLGGFGLAVTVLNRRRKA